MILEVGTGARHDVDHPRLLSQVGIALFLGGVGSVERDIDERGWILALRYGTPRQRRAHEKAATPGFTATLLPVPSWFGFASNKWLLKPGEPFIV